MCYDISYLTKKQIDYAKRYGTEADVEELKKKLPATYHTSGFEHKNIPIVTESGKWNAFSWGLIPQWVKTEDDAIKIRRSTLNARGETIFDKPAFKKASLCQRCLVIVDGFFEMHHKGGKSIPFYISRTDGQPFALAGIWDEWMNPEDGTLTNTCAIITTDANKRMSVIHNNPKVLERGGPRMPLILPFDKEQQWLDSSLPKEHVQQLILPFPESELTDFTVPPLRGKASVGNNPRAIKQYLYPSFGAEQQSLF